MLFLLSLHQQIILLFITHYKTPTKKNLIRSSIYDHVSKRNVACLCYQWVISQCRTLVKFTSLSLFFTSLRFYYSAEWVSKPRDIKHSVRKKKNKIDWNTLFITARFLTTKIKCLSIKERKARKKTQKFSIDLSVSYAKQNLYIFFRFFFYYFSVATRCTVTLYS